MTIDQVLPVAALTPGAFVSVEASTLQQRTLYSSPRYAEKGLRDTRSVSSIAKSTHPPRSTSTGHFQKVDMHPYSKKRISKRDAKQGGNLPWGLRDAAGRPIACAASEEILDVVLAASQMHAKNSASCSLFLALSEGRSAPGKRLNIKYCYGPFFGPYKSIKYENGAIRGDVGASLSLKEGFIYYDGVYYGDVMIFDATGQEDVYFPYAIDPSKSELPPDSPAGVQKRSQTKPNKPA